MSGVWLYAAGTLGIVHGLFTCDHFTWSQLTGSQLTMVWILRSPVLLHYPVFIYTASIWWCSDPHCKTDNDSNVIILSLCLKWCIRNARSNIEFTVKFHKNICINYRSMFRLWLPVDAIDATKAIRPSTRELTCQSQCLGNLL